MSGFKFICLLFFNGIYCWELRNDLHLPSRTHLLLAELCGMKRLRERLPITHVYVHLKILGIVYDFLLILS